MKLPNLIITQLAEPMYKLYLKGYNDAKEGKSPTTKEGFMQQFEKAKTLFK